MGTTRRPLARRWVAAATGLGALLAADAEAAGPPCLTTAEIVPDRAVVGQQLVYRLEILTREDVEAVDWVTSPSFPGFRSERLPGRPQHGVVEREGTTYRAREEQRALFAERPGDHAVRLVGIRCVVGRGAAAVAFEAPIPEARVAVRALPAAGAPTPASGLVGPIALRTRIAPRRVALGGTVHLEVSIQGAGNLWDAPDPLPADALPGAEIFRRPPELRLVPGKRLTVRRIFRYDVVPGEAGALQIPGVAVDAFDPAQGIYRRVVAEGARVEVAPRPSAAPTASRGGAEARRGDATPGATRWIGPVAGLLALAGLAALARARRARRPSAARQALASLRASEPSAVDATRLAGALRAALKQRLPDVEQPVDAPPAGRGAPAEVSEAAALLVALDRARFDPGAAAPDRDAVERALEKLG